MAEQTCYGAVPTSACDSLTGRLHVLHRVPPPSPVRSPAPDLQTRPDITWNFSNSRHAWPSGGWHAAVWETRGVLYRELDDHSQAAAMFREAASQYDKLARRLDRDRCRAASAGAPDGSFYFDNQPNPLDQFLVNKNMVTGNAPIKVDPASVEVFKLPAMINPGV